MNPHGTPYLRFIVPFIVGLALGAWLDFPLPWLANALLCGAAMGAVLAAQKIPYRFRWFFGTYVHILLIGFGYFHLVQYHEGRQPGHFSAHIQYMRRLPKGQK